MYLAAQLNDIIRKLVCFCTFTCVSGQARMHAFMHEVGSQVGRQAGRQVGK